MLYLLITMRQIIGNYLRYSGRHSAKSDNKQTGKGKGGGGLWSLSGTACSKSGSTKNCVVYLFS